MAMKVFNVLLVAVLMAFLATSSLADDPFVIYSGDGTMAKGPRCDMCICTRSFPPQCRCTDIKSYCHSSCKSCRCTKSIPPQCQCNDIKDYCDNSCSPHK
ncbi:hypothetical protein CKAN_01150200 [Cinnamomum micranthum f. kanehirae]|uniref:Bowman-Birk serine protease inhibitors family domain-containing protein n=1 Tax=Cinnamomum micranthum f. kanehirae TaxID=337451 RepID=A0A443NW49_9MAGN|nr:hypothetical protein CKAN_01150200 [Cinnamomum micranthum f. kanehirae]